MSARARLIALAAVAPALFAGSASAQGYFGKNQVQYQHFDWKVIETEHFLIHYYPVEREAAMDAARLAERDYTRLSRIFNHEFREKKPIMLFASRADFGQNNVTGDLGEGTGGVTEPERNRMLLPFTGDYRSFEHVLTHEMVHEFQFDVFSRGRAGAGLITLAQVNPPLWFMEGMAEYLSIGPNDPHTNTVIRDATLNNRLPSIAQMTYDPEDFFPYRFGQALFEYIGERWGDEVIGSIMAAVPTAGIPRAFQRELGKSLGELSNDWTEAMKVRYLPMVAQLQRTRNIAVPLLNPTRTGGDIFLAPTISPDGKYIAFLSNGSFLKGQVFIDVWLADAHTGKRITRLVKSTFDPNYLEVGLLYSQSAFSPDSKYLAFSALGGGKEKLYILDVAKRKRVKTIDLALDGITSPTWSPDGQHIVFNGHKGGISDLYMVDKDGKNLQQLTNDKYAQLQPAWSPDGTKIAYATDDAPGASLTELKFPKLQISVYDVATKTHELLPNQAGLNINPQWAPDSRSIIYVSNRTGIENAFLYDFDDQQQYQLSNVVGGVTGITESSPTISWSPKLDRIVFTYYEDGRYTVYAVDNPRKLRHEPYSPERNPAAVVARHDGTTVPTSVAHGLPTPAPSAAAQPNALPPGTDTTASHPVTPPGAPTAPPSGQPAPTGGAQPAPSGGAPQPDTASAPSTESQSFYRSATGFRKSSEVPGATEVAATPVVSVAAILDTGALALADTNHFKKYDYKVKFSPDFFALPSIGYTRSNFGNGISGGTAIVLSDLTGDHHLTFGAAINGSISDFQGLAAYTDASHRINFTAAILQQPYYYYRGSFAFCPQNDPTCSVSVDSLQQVVTRYLQREVVGIASYPFDRFRRLEFGMAFYNIYRYDRVFTYSAQNPNGVENIVNRHTTNYLEPHLAYVFDNVLWGVMAPISGSRYLLQSETAFGSNTWYGGIFDFRHYFPLLFNTLTLAVHLNVDISTGPQSDSVPKYVGYSSVIRGYDQNSYSLFTTNCVPPSSQVVNLNRCDPLVGSHLAFGSAELRFPLVRGFNGIPLPPIEGAIFYDAGSAWFDGQSVSLKQAKCSTPGCQFDSFQFQRGLLTSWGFSLRANLFNYLILRWDYAIPQDLVPRHGYWQFSIYPPF